MSNDADPIVGNWYEHLDKGQLFRVVAVDELNETVEIQYFDGDLEELDLDNWMELDIEPAEEPEDWSGPVDALESEPLDNDDEADNESWGEPLRSKRPHRRRWDENEDDEPWDEHEDEFGEEPWDEET